MGIEIDLFKDFAAQARAELGLDESYDDFESVRLLAWWNMRRLPQRQWTVEISNELDKRSLSTDWQVALDSIKNDAESGACLDKYMSTNIVVADSKMDKLLADWGVYHFHLGTGGKVAREVGFVDRGNELLFLFVSHTTSTIYLLDILGHGDFSRKMLLKILDNNWPDVTKRWKLGNNVVELAREYTDDEVFELRKNGINTISSVNDKYLIGLGGGISTDGYSANATHMAMTLKQYLDNTVEEILREEASIRGAIEDEKGSCPVVLKLNLSIYDRKTGQGKVVERTTGWEGGFTPSI